MCVWLLPTQQQPEETHTLTTVSTCEEIAAVLEFFLDFDFPIGTWMRAVEMSTIKRALSVDCLSRIICNVSSEIDHIIIAEVKRAKPIARLNAGSHHAVLVAFLRAVKENLTEWKRRSSLKYKE